MLSTLQNSHSLVLFRNKQNTLKSEWSHHDIICWFVDYSFEASSLASWLSCFFFLEPKVIMFGNECGAGEDNIATNDCMTPGRQMEAAWLNTAMPFMVF